jgi:hypothetical protein
MLCCSLHHFLGTAGIWSGALYLADHLAMAPDCGKNISGQQQMEKGKCLIDL